MPKFSNIALIYGSDTSEWEVSCRSGEFVASRLDDGRWNVYEIFARFGHWELVAFRNKDSMRVTLPEGSRPVVDKNDFSVSVHGEKVRLEYAYIVQHGAPGETGQMQGYLEMLGIPFNTCPAFVSAVAFDKYSCKSYLRGADFVRFAPDLLIRRGDDVEAFAKKAASLGLPVFVKPTGAGSSFGISKVTSAGELVNAVNYAFSEGPCVMVEKAVAGREFTCAAYRDKDGIRTLPVIEIVSDNDYFDYDAKYNGYSREICPAPIDAADTARIQDATAKIYALLGCKGVVRMDYIDVSADGLYFLEINTIPGMTSASLVPKMVRAAGLDVTAFLSTVIDNS